MCAGFPIMEPKILLRLHYFQSLSEIANFDGHFYESIETPYSLPTSVNNSNDAPITNDIIKLTQQDPVNTAHIFTIHSNIDQNEPSNLTNNICYYKSCYIVL